MASLSEWSYPPESLQLGNGDIHVWRAFLDVTASRQRSLEHTLSEDERKKARCFHFQRDRRRYVLSRALLRAILSRYINIEPGRILFSYNRYGKPFLDKDFDEYALRFNVSHSDEIALYAMTIGREIGIDIECVREDVASEQLAERLFSSQEIAMLRSLPSHLRREAFFNCWTRKEAYVKARGEGLSLDLKQFDVSLIPGEQPVLLGDGGNVHEISRWSLASLTPGSGYVAAIAVEGHDYQIKRWQWIE